MGGTHFILGRPGDGIFPITRYTVEFLLTGMIEQPELIQRIIEVETQVLHRRQRHPAGRRLRRRAADQRRRRQQRARSCRPRCFGEFLFPWLKAECDAAHARGKYFIKHTDGKHLADPGHDDRGRHRRLAGHPAAHRHDAARRCRSATAASCASGAAWMWRRSSPAPKRRLPRKCAWPARAHRQAGGLVLTCGNSVMVGVRYPISWRSCSGQPACTGRDETADHVIHRDRPGHIVHQRRRARPGRLRHQAHPARALSGPAARPAAAPPGVRSAAGPVSRPRSV